MIYNNRAGDGVTITPPAFNVSREKAMPKLGDHQITVFIPEQSITINTEFLEHDFDDTDDPKEAALSAIRGDHMDDVGESLEMIIFKVTPI
jgi:hypothetical protein